MRRVIKKLLLEYVVITKYRYKNRAINEWEYQEEQFEVIGENPKRMKAQKRLEKIRIESNKMKNSGVPLEKIIMDI